MMKAARLLGVVVLILVVATGARVFTRNVPDLRGPLPPERILADTEELVYEVSWSFFKLGTIRLTSRRDFTATAYIDSYETVPFVSLHAMNRTLMDSSFSSVASSALDLKEDERWHGLSYQYDRASGRLFVDEVVHASPLAPPLSTTRVDTLEVGVREFVDGLSIAMYPRRFVHVGRVVTVPTVLYGKVGSTSFDFADGQTTESIEAVEEPVRVIEVHGNTTVVGVYGMTGDFTGWFSDDSAAIPLKGKLKVLLGTVNVELIQWRRPGWTPPTQGM